MSERLLGGVLELHGVDVEAVARRAVYKQFQRLGAWLSPDECDDAPSFVISEVWRASLDFDESRGSFSARASSIASARTIDWLRQRLGRSKWVWSTHAYEREQPLVVSLDAPASSDNGDIRLGDVIAERAGDRETDRDALSARDLLDERARHRARDYDELGLSTLE
jgi:hypothetical protein